MIWIALTIAFMILTILRYHKKEKALTKPLASAGFLATAVHFGAFDGAYGIAVFSALCASFVGDVLLIRKTKLLFMLGLFAFALAHIGFIVAFSLHEPVNITLASAIIATLATAVAATYVIPNVSEHVWMVAAYIVIISVMLGMAYTTPVPLVWAGASLFYLSDIFVARNAFIKKEDINHRIGLPVYYLAQLCLACSVGI